MTAQQLKNSILKLAISGKLVPQDPNDEPASVLIEKIMKEKEKLVKEGKIKKEKNPSYIFRASDNMPYEKVGDNEPVCIADEVPFEIPDGWEWCRLKNISQLIGGYAFKGNAYTNKGIRVIRISDFDNDGLLYDEYKYYTESQSLSNYEIYSNDILMCMTGGTVGKCCFLNTIKEKLYLNQRVADIRCSKLISQYYVYNVLISYYIQELINASKTSTNDNISMETIGDFIIPLPPLAEQQRIVTEIKNYLPLINEYDKLQTELDTLDKEFPEKLKKSILQQAIQGKLVEQDSSDEPASVLLEKIRKEKEKLIKEGKIKKDKNESIIYKRDNSYYEKLNGVEKCIDDEIPFEIPESWEWCRFNSVVNYHMGKTPPRKDSKYWNNAKHNWISIADMIPNGIISGTKEKVNDYSVEKIFKNQITKKGTLIMSFKLTVGRVSILDIDAYHNEAIISIYPYNNANNVFTNFLFKFLPLLTTFGDAKTAIKGNTLNSSSINNLLIPLPPITEQNRIIDVINQLINCIDKQCIYK